MVFVTTTVVDWLPLFSDEKIAEMTTKQLQETGYKFHISIAAYVLMPSHLHLLVGLLQLSQLSQFMQAFKGLSSRLIFNSLSSLEHRDIGYNPGKRIWKPRFDDLIIWSEKQFKIKTEYIHNNPVKAGLVANSCDYRFSSAGDWLRDTPGLIRIDKNWSWIEREGLP